MPDEGDDLIERTRVGRTPDPELKLANRGLIPYTARAVLPRYDRDQPPACPSHPGQIDPGIRLAVQRLQEHGVETFESCEGGEGHAYPEPTVAFYGGPYAGWKAMEVCLAYALPVIHLRRVWDVLDGEPTGPHWEVVFRKRLP
jgi:hypothetical protein